VPPRGVTPYPSIARDAHLGLTAKLEYVSDDLISEVFEEPGDSGVDSLRRDRDRSDDDVPGLTNQCEVGPELIRHGSPVEVQVVGEMSAERRAEHRYDLISGLTVWGRRSCPAL